MKKLIILLLINFFFINTQAQTAHKYLRKGNKSYETENYNTAEERYRKSLEKDNTYKGNYNLGNSIYEQERYNEAVKHFEGAIASAKSQTDKAKAFHNLGTAHLKGGQYEKSIEAYKHALRMNPSDMETKYNLSYAMQKLRQQQQQQKQQQQQQDQQNQNQDNSDKQEKDQPKDQNSEEQQNPQQKPIDNENKENQQPQPRDLTKEEARQLLEIMDNEEQKVQKKMKKARGQKSKSKKDW